jgi:hypothetical protein
MKRTAVSCLMLAFVAWSVFSQTLRICGWVTDQNGKPLTHTVVRLGQTTFDNGYGKSPYMATTDVYGHYQLGSACECVAVGPGCIPEDVIPKSTLTRGGAFSQPLNVGGKVLLNVPARDAMVRMSLYDLSGRLIREVMNRSLTRGNYSVSIDPRGISSQFYLLRVTINGAASVIKLQPLSHVAGGGVIQNAPEFQTRLEKLVAVVDTLHATEPGYTIGVTPLTELRGRYDFSLTKNTTWNGDKAAFWGDTSTYPKTGGAQYIILNRTNGAFPDSKIFWSIQEKGAKTSIAAQPSVQIPVGGGRFCIWIAPTDSGNRYFDLIEVSNGVQWFGNTTRVEGWKLPISFRVHTSTGIDTTMGDEYEMFYTSRQAKFDEFKNEVPKEFTGLATQDFANIWAPHTSPVNYFNTGGPYENYYIAYENAVNALYHGTLVVSPTINVFNSMGGGGMGSDPWFSSALNRHVATLPQGTNRSIWFNDTNYYKEAPCNYYSKWCHRRSLHNLCYGFPYDDAGNHAAFVQQYNVQWVAIAIGW